MTRIRQWWGWRHEPPPCPICGAPHTTCTSPGYAAGAVTMAVRRPRALLVRPEPPPPATTVVSEPFTTATYKRPPKAKRR